MSAFAQQAILSAVVVFMLGFSLGEDTLARENPCLVAFGPYYLSDLLERMDEHSADSLMAALSQLEIK